MVKRLTSLLASNVEDELKLVAIEAYKQTKIDQSKETKVEACRKPKCKEREKVSELPRVLVAASIVALLKEKKSEIGS